MEKKEKSRSVNIRRIIVLIVLLLFLFVEVITNRAEYLKIKEIGESYTNIFFTNLYMKILIFGVIFVITYLIFFINNKMIKKGMKHFFEKEEKEMPKLPNKSVSLIVALIAGECSLKFLYTPLINCINATSFGIQDAIFGQDIGFYMFILPFIKSLLIFLIVVSLIMIIYTAIYYVIAINICLKNGVEMQSLKESVFIKQIKFLAIVFGIFISAYILVAAQDILTGEMISIKNDAETELVGARFS